MVFCDANTDLLHEITCVGGSDPDLGGDVCHNISRCEIVGKKHLNDFPVLAHCDDGLSVMQRVLTGLR